MKWIHKMKLETSSESPLILAQKRQFLSKALIMNFPRRVWDLLTAPMASVERLDQRRQARMLSGFLLFLLTFGLGITCARIVTDYSNIEFDRLINILLLVGLVSVAYSLSRTIYYSLAAILTGLGFSFYILMSFITGFNGNQLEPLYYLLIPVLLSSMFASIRATIFVAVFNLVGMLALPIWNPSISFVKDPLELFIYISLLMLLTARQRNLLEQDRQKELIENEARYRTLLETTFEGMATLENGTISNVNSGFARIFNYELEEINDQPISNFIMGRTDILFAQNLGTETEHPFEATGQKKDGSLIEIELVARILTYQGRLVQVVAVRDISARKQAEKALAQAQRLDSMGMLAGGIAHDFKNMVAGIKAQVSLALTKLPEDHKARKNIEKVITSTERATDLTRQLLVYAGKAEVEIKKMETNTLIREIVEMIEPTLSQNVLLHLNLSTFPLFLKADKGQIQQVILNLIVNAGQAMPNDGGEIVVTTKSYQITEEENTFQFIGRTQLTSGSYLHLEVRDTGSGMDSATLSHIFDPFFTTKESGTGIGLASTIGIISSHDGAISVKSQVGIGTTFTVLLPMVEEYSDTLELYDAILSSEPSEQELNRSILHLSTSISQHELLSDIDGNSAYQRGTDLESRLSSDDCGAKANKQIISDSLVAQPSCIPKDGTPTILVIDDEDPIREAVVEILEMVDMQVCEACNGQEGVARFRENPNIDLVLLDMQMPIMNGEETFHILQSINPEVKVVLSSGFGESETAQHFSVHGFTGFLQKPYDISELITKVQTILLSSK